MKIFRIRNPGTYLIFSLTLHFLYLCTPDQMPDIIGISVGTVSVQCKPSKKISVRLAYPLSTISIITDSFLKSTYLQPTSSYTPFQVLVSLS